MKAIKSGLSLFLAAAVGAVAVGAHAVALETDETETAKGLFYAPTPKPRPGVKFNVIEIEGKNLDKRKKRKTSHDFKPGDRLNFEFEVNRPGYIYILNRTILGHPDRLRRYMGRGISALMADDLGRVINAGPRQARYTLLYPGPGSHGDNYVHKGQLRVVPQTGQFVMDNEPGIEKLFFVWSPVPIDMSQYFDLRTGQLVASTIESYGMGINDEGPMMVEIDLTHEPR
jgi:hypothetical protein